MVESVLVRSGELRLILLKPVVRLVVVVGWLAFVVERLKISLLPLLLLLLLLLLPFVMVILREISRRSPGVVSMLCLPPLKSLLCSRPRRTVCARGSGLMRGVDDPVVAVVPALDLESTKGSSWSPPLDEPEARELSARSLEPEARARKLSVLALGQ